MYYSCTPKDSINTEKFCKLLQNTDMEHNATNIYIIKHFQEFPNFIMFFYIIISGSWKGSKRDTWMFFFRKRDMWKTENINVIREKLFCTWMCENLTYF